MKPIVGVAAVAQRAGVSLGTVSNVLNHPERVAPKTRNRVLKAISELGFVRNEAARQLRAGRSRTVGLIVLDVANPFFTDVAQGAEAAAADQGLSIVICDSHEAPARESRYLSLLEEQRVYGILLAPVLGTSEGMTAIASRGTPVVLVDRGSARQQCSVSVDDRAGGEMAVRHLAEMGHRRIAFVGGPMAIQQVSDRLQGARTALQVNGRARDQLTVIETDALNVSGGRQAGVAISEMGQRRRPTAAFCANDLLALGLLQEMTARGISVPGDLAIVGYDDIIFAQAAAVPLTSVSQPRRQLGRAAMEALIDEVERPGEHEHRQIVFQPELVVRASSDGVSGRSGGLRDATAMA